MLGEEAVCLCGTDGAKGKAKGALTPHYTLAVVNSASTGGAPPMPERRKYSHISPESRDFWKRIDALREISSNRWRECFSLGGALQDLEERTLKALEEAEGEAAKLKR